jgi:hypothetical protein
MCHFEGVSIVNDNVMRVAASWIGLQPQLVAAFWLASSRLLCREIRALLWMEAEEGDSVAYVMKSAVRHAW